MLSNFKSKVVKCVFSLENNSGGRTGFDGYGIATAEARKSLKKYNFAIPDYLEGEINPGDFVVVNCVTGFQICEVVETNVVASSLGLALVVAKVPMHEYFNYVSNQEQLKLMKQEIVNRRKKLEDKAVYDLLAEKDPDFAALLKHFRDMGGEL